MLKMAETLRNLQESTLNIVLIGFKSCGKTTVGKLLAKQLHRAFYDTDAMLLDKTGGNIFDLFNLVGEKKFRLLEREIILNMNVNNSVIALGGGTILDDVSMTKLTKDSFFIYLDVDKEMLRKRILSDKMNIFKNDIDKFEKAYALRKEIYKKYADMSIACTEEMLEEICSKIASVPSLK
jgi:shikimate kinase